MKIYAIYDRLAEFQFTPLREGRLRNCCGTEAFISFQFTPLREGRHTKAVNQQQPEKFQFTPLREGRPQKTLTQQTYGPFQFTPLREGRRLPAAQRLLQHSISIHAPARGATAKLNKICSVFSAIIEKNS